VRHGVHLYVYVCNRHIKISNMRTNTVLDDGPVREAFAPTGIRTKRELIDTAPKELIRIRKKQNLLDLAGEIEFRHDFTNSRAQTLESLLQLDR